MTDRNIEASKRLFEMAQEGKTPEEMTAELAAMGSTLFVKPGHKFGNAILDQGVGSVELVTVEDGKCTSAAGTENDILYFCGEVYHFAEDHVTLVPGYPEKAEAPDKLPEAPDKGRHPEWAGRDDIIQKTQNGTFRSTFDEDGYHVKSVKVVE